MRKMRHLSYGPLKTPVEVTCIRRSCRFIEVLFRHIKPMVRPGVNMKELLRICELAMARKKVRPSLELDAGFPYPVSFCLNDVAAHGMPADYVLRDNDLLTIDITVALEGWHGDGAWTYLSGKVDEEGRALVRAAWRCTMAGIRAAVAGGFVRDIGATIEEEASRVGCSVIPDFAGHGIGRAYHEEPLIYHHGIPGTGLKIVPGMVFTIEPIVTFGRPEVFKDGTGGFRMRDGSKTAQFEHTVAVFPHHTEILTLGRRQYGDDLLREDLFL
ncbi:type I methionyl aminopeptidase [Spirochaeta thermophila]|nr:type I methionyl aminopeptidase [Spirochaeta thermophila]